MFLDVFTQLHPRKFSTDSNAFLDYNELTTGDYLNGRQYTGIS